MEYSNEVSLLRAEAALNRYDHMTTDPTFIDLAVTAELEKDCGWDENSVYLVLKELYRQGRCRTIIECISTVRQSELSDILKKINPFPQ